MAESSATERYETCIRQHSRTCTCGITETQCMAYAAAEAADGDPDCTTGQPLISQEVLDGVTVAGARAFWHAKDIEAKHEALRADVMTVVSNPHLTWEQARKALTAALTEGKQR